MPIEQQRALDRREEILEAALQIFAQRGYHEASVDEIAAESHTSKGGCYFHFPNKQAIFLALLDRMTKLLRSRAEAALAAESEPIAKAEAALKVAFDTFTSHRRLTRLFLVEALGAGPAFHARLAEARLSFTELIRVQLDAAVREGAIAPLDTTVASQVWFGALNEVVTAWVLAESATPLAERYGAVRALLFRAIGLEPRDNR